VNGRLNPLKIQCVDSTAQKSTNLNQVEQTNLETHGETIATQFDTTVANAIGNLENLENPKGSSTQSIVPSDSQPFDVQSHLHPVETRDYPSAAWRWLLTGLVLCCAVGGLASLAFVWLTSLPPRTNCDEISPISPDIDRLYCAQVAAESGELDDLMAGLRLVEAWSPDNPLYNESRRWMNEWSESVLVIARQKMAASDIEGAIELANRVPKSSPLYADAQKAIAQWRKNWQIDEAIYAKAENALKTQDWNGVSQHILELSESPYERWNTEKVNELSQRVLLEKKARQTLAQAKRTAEIGAPDNLQAALNMAKAIDAKTYTWAEAQPLFSQWGDTLLTLGFNRWRERRFDEAIAYAGAASVSSTLAAEAQHLLNLSKARQLALASGSNWKPQPKHVWNLMEAVAAARQIPADSRFYAQAQESLASWEAQLQATMQLQYAQVMAELGQRDSLQTAIAQAEQIPPNHPRRLQAQTLVAHWKQEVQRVEDQPYLLFAQQLAQSGAIDDLKLAIAEAGKVGAGRALRDQAQGLIYDWTRQIQVLEDQPLLAEAMAQAQRGNLTEAMRIAAQIPANRALYSEAQAAIADWQAELNRAELARTQIQRNEANSTNSNETYVDDLDNQAEDSDRADETPTVTKTPKIESPAVATPRPLPPVGPPQQTTRRVPELPSPFVLEEEAPLFEEEPDPQVEYDADDIPRLIRRQSERSNNPAPVVNESPAASEIFPPLEDATLFEEPPAETAPALESVPVEAEPVVEELPSNQELPSGAEASAIEPLLPSESSQPEESTPLSMESSDKEVSGIVEETYPVSMIDPENLSENEIEPIIQFSNQWN
jgi:hypothetical protein